MTNTYPCPLCNVPHPAEGCEFSDETLHEALARFGIGSTKASDSRRYLHLEADDSPLGTATSEEGWNLVRLLDSVSQEGS